MNNVNMMNAYPAARATHVSAKGKNGFLIAEISTGCVII